MAATFLDIYLAFVESVGVTQRWLDAELSNDEPDEYVTNALASLLQSETRFMLKAQRMAENEIK
jgi:hypothetical protein